MVQFSKALIGLPSDAPIHGLHARHGQSPINGDYPTGVEMHSHRLFNSTGEERHRGLSGVLAQSWVVVSTCRHSALSPPWPISLLLPDSTLLPRFVWVCREFLSSLSPRPNLFPRLWNCSPAADSCLCAAAIIPLTRASLNENTQTPVSSHRDCLLSSFLDAGHDRPLTDSRSRKSGVTP